MPPGRENDWLAGGDGLVDDNSVRFCTPYEADLDAHIVYCEAGVLDCNESAVGMLGVRSRSEILGSQLRQWSPECQPDGSLQKSVRR